MGEKVIITGATGMVGGIVLYECLKNDAIKEVITVGRKPCGIKHEKLTEILHQDFTSYASLENQFKGVDIAYFCMGVYTGSVDREEFRKITVDYTAQFAKMLKEHSPNSRFCFLSGAGADQTEKSRMMFAKDKGTAENFLVKQQFTDLFIFRPGYIYPETPREEPNFSYRLSRWLYPFLKIVFPNNVVTSEQLGKAIFLAGVKGGPKMILENKDILAYS